MPNDLPKKRSDSIESAKPFSRIRIIAAIVVFLIVIVVIGVRGLA